MTLHTLTIDSIARDFTPFCFRYNEGLPRALYAILNVDVHSGSLNTNEYDIVLSLRFSVGVGLYQDHIVLTQRDLRLIAIHQRLKTYISPTAYPTTEPLHAVSILPSIDWCSSGTYANVIECIVLNTIPWTMSPKNPQDCITKTPSFHSADPARRHRPDNTIRNCSTEYRQASVQIGQDHPDVCQHLYQAQHIIITQT